jgi:hypothetical protein
MTHTRRIAKHAATAAKHNAAMRKKAQKLFEEVGRDVARMPPVSGHKGRWVVVEAAGDGEDGGAAGVVDGVVDGGVVVVAEMTCVRCDKAQPRDLDHFFGSHGGKYVESALPGQESMKNSVRWPCKACRRTNLTPREWAQIIGMKYKMTADDVLALFNDPAFKRCPYTLFPRKHMTLARNHQWAPSINGTVLATGEKYDAKNHGKNIEAVLAIVNIRQGSKDRVYVDSLSWRPMYRGMTAYARTVMNGRLNEENTRLVAEARRRFQMTPKESGVTANKSVDPKEYDAQRNKLHMKYFLRVRAQSHAQEDRKKGRPNDMPRTEDYLERIVAQNGRCALSMVPIELVNGALGPSADRPGNHGGHTHDNVRMILRLLQCGQHFVMTRRRLVHMYLVSGMAPPDVIEFYLCEHELLAEAGEACAACDAGIPLTA